MPESCTITTYVPRGQFDWIKANLAGQLHISPQLNTYYYGFNLTEPPFKDNLPLRRALSLVIDREQLAKLVLRVGELPAYGWIPPGVHDYTAAVLRLPRHAHGGSHRRGAPALRAGGLFSGQTAALRAALQLGRECTTGSPSPSPRCGRKRSASKCTPDAVEFKSLLQDIDRGDVEMFRSSWFGDYNDAYTFAQYFKSDFGINLPHYQQRRIRSPASRRGRAKRMSRNGASCCRRPSASLLHDHPLIPLYFYVNKHLVKPRGARAGTTT